MHNVNTRGTFLVSKECMPYLRKSSNPHILNISPPLNMAPHWFGPHVAYTMAKYGMSMCVLGMAHELRDAGIGVNALWPRTAISTAAMDMLSGGAEDSTLRKVDIMADAAYEIFTRDPKTCTGNFFIDDDLLRSAGITDMAQYRCNPATPEDQLMPDFFLDVTPEQMAAGGNEKVSSIYAAKTGDSAEGNIPKLFTKIEGLLSAELVQRVGACYQFNVKGAEAGTWFLDLKSGTGKTGKGEPATPPDSTLTMDSKHFTDMFEGKLKAANAFMTGKLKISGDLQKAMKLEKLMSSLKSKL